MKRKQRVRDQVIECHSHATLLKIEFFFLFSSESYVLSAMCVATQIFSAQNDIHPLFVDASGRKWICTEN